MRANNVFKAVLCAAIVPSTVGKQNRGTPHAEEAIRDKHRPVLPLVPVVPHHLRAHHHRVVIRVRLENILGQVHTNDPRAAPHSAEVVAQNVPSHLVVVYDHR